MTDWNKKLAAWLHDPAEKALILMRDAAGHEGGTVARLYAELGLSRADFDARADHLAAAADRPQWPRKEDGGRYQAFEQVRFDRQPELVHPLSGRRLKLGPLTDDIAIEPIKAASVDHLRGFIHPGDPKSTFLAFWRFGPELGRMAPEVGVLWEQLPADTRVPDHTIWSHVDTVAALHTALAGDADGPDQPALLVMSLGPVQGFIRQARSGADLWAGSHLLSSLMGVALATLAERLGPDAVLFPALRGTPAIDRWLIERDEAANPAGGRFRALFEKIGAPLLKNASDANPLFSASLPNKFVAIVPSRQVRDIAARITAAVRAQALDWARQAAQRVFDEAGMDMMPVTRAQIDEQMRDFPEVSWAAATWPVGKDAQALDAAAGQVRAGLHAVHPKLAEAGVFSPAIWDVLRRTVDLDGIKFWTPNTGILYPAVYELADRAAAAAKAVRPFAATTQHGHRCTLTGEHEWLTHDRDLLRSGRRDRATQSVWGRLVRKRPGWVKRGEHLGTRATLKRLWPVLFAEQVGAFLGLPEDRRVRRYMVSTHALAASTSIERLLAEHEAGGLHESQIRALHELTERPGQPALDQVALPARLVRQLYRLPDELARALRRLPAALEADESDEAGDSGKAGESRPVQADRAGRADGRLLRELFGNAPPEAYYAIIKLDGDRMGSWISGGAGTYQPTFADSWHSQVAQAASGMAASNPALKRYLQTRRPGSPARHGAISQALGQFSTRVARYVVEDCFKGKLLYAGGDDVLALVAVDDLPDAMQLLRLAYSGIAPDAAMGLDEHVGTLRAGGAARQRRLLLRDGFGLLDGRLLQLMGEHATASMGAVIAHHMAPLSMVLRRVGEAEHRAKDAGRDSFCLRVLKRGGGEVSLTSHWWGRGEAGPDVSRSALALLRELAAALAGTSFSRGALYIAQQWFDGLTDSAADVDSNEWRSQMTGALSYQFERQQGERRLAREIVDFVCEVMRPAQPRTAIENFLMTAEFLAREGRAFRLTGQPDERPGRMETRAA